MEPMEWNSAGSRFYEAGLDRGVLYVDDSEYGVPWYGLISVDERINTSVTEVFYDGTKINDIVVLGNFSGRIRAITYPDDFFACEGVVLDQQGMFLTEQQPKRFGLCYRTLIGEGSNDLKEGYKLHILYNLTAVPSTKVRRTLGLEVDPIEFEWEITSIPEQVAGFRPTAHVIIDSRYMDPWLLQDLEAILYGSEERFPTLPDLKSLTSFIKKWDRLIIVDNADGTWTAISARPDIITMVSDTEFEITADSAVYLDATTYEISSSDKNEEDI
jgi:hypothetical protein